MKRTRLAAILFFALQTLLHSSVLSAQPLAEFNQNGFPLAVGNRWEYRATSTWNPDNREDLSRYTTLTDVTWEITAREIVLGQEAYCFEITHRFLAGPDSGAVRTARTWFAMDGDTLRSVASINTGGLEPLMAQLHKPVVQEDEPDSWDIISLIFPLYAGQSWDFGTGFFEKDIKVVEAEEMVSVPAGEFETFRVVRIVEAEGVNVRTEQWFSTVGVVKMRDQEILEQDRLGEGGEALEKFTNRGTAAMELARFHLVRGSTAVEWKSWGQIKDSD